MISIINASFNLISLLPLPLFFISEVGNDKVNDYKEEEKDILEDEEEKEKGDNETKKIDFLNEC